MDEKNKNEKSWSAVSLAWELGFTIAIPVVILALLGRFLDKKLGTDPWLILAGVILSVLISSYLIYKKTAEIMDKSQ